MSEIHVPYDAKNILIRIVNAAQQVEADNDYSRDLGTIDLDEARHFQQQLDRFLTSLRLLPFSWCKIDPLEYKCKGLKSKVSGLWILAFSPISVSPSARPKEFAVPKQIFDINNLVVDKINSELRDQIATNVRELLSELYESVSIRFEVEELSKRSGQKKQNCGDRFFELSADNRTAYLNGKEYILTEKEGAVIRYLYEMSKQGFPNVEKQTLIDFGCGKQSTVTDVRDIFADRHTYRALIKHVRKSLYRLNI